MQANLRWVENMLFECNNRGLSTAIDAAVEHGGTDEAPNPKELVLNAMMGCSAMDVMSILKKMRVSVDEFKMSIEATKTKEHPIHFESATLIFDLKGEIPQDKIIKAVDSSLTRYCGVNFMISKTCEIDFKVNLNGELIHTGKANFDS